MQTTGNTAIRLLAAALLAALSPAARAGLLDEARKTTRQQLAVEARRIELPNGLVVLLAPDPTASSVAVSLTFRAGAIREPAGRSGLAHLVEHLLATGPTPDTDYAGLLEARRARYFNAHTGLDTMSFEVVVPPEELPVALWTAADRLGTLGRRIDAAELERNRRIVQQERALRSVDAPYGLVGEQLFRRLYQPPHPLHGGVIGVPAELAAIGLDDVRAFISEFLVPANAVLAVVGRFDPAVAEPLVEQGLGRFPGGARARRLPLPPPPAPYIDAREEWVSRRPRVTLAWRLPGIAREDAVALQVGAQLLTFFVDGAWGMEISAGLSQYEGESLFCMELTVPYDEPMQIVHRDAAGFLRMLTHKEMPLDFLIAANLALDRIALFRLDTLEGRALALSSIELLSGGSFVVADHLDWHWQLDGSVLRDTARVHLKAPMLVLHARPKRPKAAREERE